MEALEAAFAAWCVKFVSFVWNKPVVLLCLFTGIYFSFRFLFIQFRALPHAIDLIKGKYDDPNEVGQITHFQALSAALSGTIGLGNIAGVAIAISLGGPGSIFWMWVVGFFGMATKYVECSLGTHYRSYDEKTGEVRGGPMYYITKGLGKKWKPMAMVYAVLLGLASFGSASMFQTNQAASALHNYYGIPMIATGLVIFVCAVLVIIGGIKRIGKVASRVVPTMCVIYVLGAIAVCLVNLDKVPYALSLIFTEAFGGSAAMGGAIGTVISMGVKRAIFSNEAGLGTAPIAHAAVKTNYPIREGIVASVGPFIDTVVVCTATALVIIMSGHFGTERYQVDSANKTVSFETVSSDFVLPEGWLIEKDNVPENTDRLRKFVDGDTVLAYSNVAKTGQPMVFPPVLYEGHAIRFSYFKQQGSMRAVLLNELGQEITRFKMGDGDSQLVALLPTGETRVVGELLGHHVSGQWQSAVLEFKEEISQLGLVAGRPVFLKLIPEGKGEVVWYFDRIQSVHALSGISLTTNSFDAFFNGFGSVFITISVFFFAFSTIITWGYYGETAVTYTFGEVGAMVYKALFVFMIIIGAIESLDVVVNFTDGMIGLLVIPNTIAILLLSPKVARWTKEYFSDLKAGKIQPTEQ